ncbi:MAG: PEP-CTERM sorting domain-containing protein [Cyanothece sp. SIO1E1]|nr:PEP-CTERM sorting domain-containing protein [Cyanothece sp. SIO1E1]
MILSLLKRVAIATSIGACLTAAHSTAASAQLVTTDATTGFITGIESLEIGDSVFDITFESGTFLDVFPDFDAAVPETLPLFAGNPDTPADIEAGAVQDAIDFAINDAGLGDTLLFDPFDGAVAYWLGFDFLEPGELGVSGILPLGGPGVELAGPFVAVDTLVSATDGTLFGAIPPSPLPFFLDFDSALGAGGAGAVFAVVEEVDVPEPGAIIGLLTVASIVYGSRKRKQAAVKRA